MCLVIVILLETAEATGFLNSSVSTLEIFENCGHVVNVEMPVKFNEVVISFLGKFRG